MDVIHLPNLLETKADFESASIVLRNTSAR